MIHDISVQYDKIIKRSIKKACYDYDLIYPQNNFIEEKTYE